MAKRIYITESQLEEALGLNLSYLDNSDMGINHDNNDSEISVSDKKENDIPTPITTDKIQKNRAPRGYFGARRRYTTLNCSTNKSQINEVNQDLVNKKYRIPDFLYSKLQNNLSQYKGDGSQRLGNIINMRDIKTNEMYRILNHLNTINADSDEFNALGGEEMKRWIETQLKNAKNVSHNTKETKRKMGDKNAFIKTHTKSNCGQAHSKKNNATFTYEN